ncbi:metalloregulator ArsR/SmtB family transcription factor [Jeotgalicoccus huakuii]|uniref:ArsR/SmtB family transcription factor n=1 Tax=unclassified Jeotgalicoccus TaxID=2630462 RepID=UPI0014152C17|nr:MULTISPECIES: metalloregulator ArsR/SmtB family transcription factor [unclassified Jeotgalicoccus]MCK1976440.1 metalloregulator ArsR/SmtB family transcription factor [Jeotgalicoccus huakuii]QQD84386.1 winged helix-turn-helix transcriptional regulator [Jeotgalicoccus sp. ATCC 8456]
MNYSNLATQLRILADESRLEIIDLLSCNELCGHDILSYFNFSQPTLSHHMKVLVENRVVTKRREGNKFMYRLNNDILNDLKQSLDMISRPSSECICHSITEDCNA